MFMDFAQFAASKGATLPVIEPLSARVVERLKRLQIFVVHCPKKGEESGIVHQSLRSLYEAHAHVRDSMQSLAQLPLLLMDGMPSVCFFTLLLRHLLLFHLLWS